MPDSKILLTPSKFSTGSVILRKLALFSVLLFFFVIPSYAGRMKTLLKDAEDMIYAEMSTLRDYKIEIHQLRIYSNSEGIIVIATVVATNNITRRSSLHVWEVQFEGTMGNYKPIGVQCF